MGMMSQLTQQPQYKTLIVYGKGFGDHMIPKWKERFSSIGMELNLHPDFSFSTINGYLPMALKVNEAKRVELTEDTFKTGFEFFCDTFDFAADFPKPKGGLFSRKKAQGPVVSEETDAILERCDGVLTINFTEDDSLVLRAACMSAAVLAEISGGVVRNPLSRKWRPGDRAVEEYKGVVVMQEDGIVDFKLRAFGGW